VFEHNEGNAASTASRRPFKLIYYEAYEAKADAKHREFALKRRGQARKHLMTRLGNTLRQNQS
jgi:predicted GIY-YIG superfamily endonuclease